MPNSPRINSPRFVDTTQNAIQQREAHTRSIHAICQHRLNQIQGPNLPLYLPTDTTSGDARLAQAVARFQDSPEFPAFRMQVLQHLQNLYRECADTPGQVFEQSSWGRFAGRLGLIPLFPGDTPFIAELYMMYYQSCPVLNRLSAMLQLSDEFRAVFPPSLKQEMVHQLRQLMPALAVCGPGVIQNISATYDTINYRMLPPDLHTLFKNTRIQIAREHFQQIVREVYHADPHLPNNEIHMVAAFQNSMAEGLDLPFIDDRYAAPIYVAQSGLTPFQLGMRLMTALAPESVCNAIATQALEKLKDFMAEAGPVPTNPQFFNSLLEENLERLKPVIGDVSPYLVADLDGNMVPYRVTNNATLLALDLLQRLPPNVKLTYFDRMTMLLNELQKPMQLAMATSLTWIEETVQGKTEKRLLNLSDLTPANAQRILEVMDGPLHRIPLIAYEALRNLDLPGTLYFRQVPFDPSAGAINEAAIAAACATLPNHAGLPNSLARHLQARLETTGAARLLLSGQSNLLTPEQTNFLINSTSPEQSISLNELDRFTFAEFVLDLKNKPEQNMYKASPELFQNVMGRIRFTEAGIQKFSLRWALEPNPAYIQIARMHADVVGHLNPEALLPQLITECDKGNAHALPVVQRMVSEITAPDATAQNYNSLISQLLASSVPDSECAAMVRALRNKNTHPEVPATDAMQFESSALGLALSAGKIECAALLLQDPSPIAFNIHKEVWIHAAKMLALVPHPAQAWPILQALVNKGARLNMPERQTTALIELCSISNSAIHSQLIALGCDPAAKDSRGKNALFNAIERLAPISAIADLMEIGVPLDKEGDHYPAIELALALYNTDVGGILYRKLGKLNKLDANGYGEIHKSILRAGNLQNGFEKVLELRRIEALLKAGCDPNVRTNASHMMKTPLHLAYKHLPEVCQLLLYYGASPNMLDLKLREPHNMQQQSQ